MKSYSSINSRILWKLLNSYKLTTRGKKEIVKAAQKRFITGSFLNRLARKIEFKGSIANKNKQL